MARADVGAGVGEEQHVARERLRGVDHRRQRLVVDDDELGGVDALGAGLGEDDGDDVPDEADDVAGEERSSHPLVETGNGGGWNVPRSTSAAVNTCVPGSCRAADTSTPTIRACAYGERTNVAWSAPGRSRFST